MKKILYIIPYFGKFPSLFPLWLESCRYNPTINWIIFTDDETVYDYPDNIEVIYTTFREIRKKIQELYDFPISLEKPYKLCDYKVAYGDIFSNYIDGYDFWGYCDIDLLWGDIRSFLTDDILSNYKKIGWLGHSSLYKNNNLMNKLYKCTYGGKSLYMDIFQSDSNCFFDEKGINLICKEHNVSIYDKVIFADLTPLTWNFQINYVSGDELLKNRHRIFFKDKEKLYSLSVLHGELFKDSYMYVHFLRRRIKIGIKSNALNYLIVPNKIIPMLDSFDKSSITSYSRNNMLKYWVELVIAKRKKMTIRNIIHYFLERYKATRK